MAMLEGCLEANQFVDPGTEQLGGPDGAYGHGQHQVPGRLLAEVLDRS